MTYARIQNNTVVEIVKPVDGFSIQQCFHPDLLKNVISCPDEVQAGWAYKPETGQFSAPEVTDPEISTSETSTSEESISEAPAAETPTSDEPSA